MRHPDSEFFGQSLEERSALSFDSEIRRTVLFRLPSFDFSSESLRNPLVSVTESENGNAKCKDALIRLRTLLVVHALRTTGENDPRCTLERACRGFCFPNLRICPEPSHSVPNEMGILSTKVEDHDRAGVQVSHAFGSLYLIYHVCHKLLDHPYKVADSEIPDTENLIESRMNSDTTVMLNGIYQINQAHLTVGIEVSEECGGDDNASTSERRSDVDVIFHSSEEGSGLHPDGVMRTGSCRT